MAKSVDGSQHGSDIFAFPAMSKFSGVIDSKDRIDQDYQVADEYVLEEDHPLPAFERKKKGFIIRQLKVEEAIQSGDMDELREAVTRLLESQGGHASRSAISRDSDGKSGMLSVGSRISIYRSRNADDRAVSDTEAENEVVIRGRRNSVPTVSLSIMDEAKSTKSRRRSMPVSMKDAADQVANREILESEDADFDEPESFLGKSVAYWSQLLFYPPVASSPTQQHEPSREKYTTNLSKSSEKLSYCIHCGMCLDDTSLRNHSSYCTDEFRSSLARLDANINDVSNHR